MGQMLGVLCNIIINPLMPGPLPLPQRRPSRDNNVNLMNDQVLSLKESFMCLICHETVTDPIMCPRCQSIVGCAACLQDGPRRIQRCPKCMTAGFGDSYLRLKGVDEALDAIRMLPD